MGTVRVIFSRRHHIGSLALRTFMWSAWSHCGIIAGDEVIEAVMGKGVVITPLAEFQNHASKWAVIKIPAADPAAVIEWARNQEGKRYDIPGVLGIALRRAWQDADAWFCSELVAAAFHAAGTALFRTDAWRITPRDLYIRTY
jgi:uncharacterized protein YycO